MFQPQQYQAQSSVPAKSAAGQSIFVIPDGQQQQPMASAPANTVVTFAQPPQSQPSEGCCGGCSCNCLKVFASILGSIQACALLGALIGTSWYETRMVQYTNRYYSSYSYYPSGNYYQPNSSSNQLRAADTGGWNKAGLFQRCLTVLIIFDECKDWHEDEVSGRWKAVPGLLGFAGLLVAVASVLSFVSCCCSKKKPVAVAASALFACATFFSLAGYCLTLEQIGKWQLKSQGSQGSSAHACIASILFGIIATLLMGLGACKDKEKSSKTEPNNTVVHCQSAPAPPYMQTSASAPPVPAGDADDPDADHGTARIPARTNDTAARTHGTRLPERILE